MYIRCRSGRDFHVKKLGVCCTLLHQFTFIYPFTSSLLSVRPLTTCFDVMSDFVNWSVDFTPCVIGPALQCSQQHRFGWVLHAHVFMCAFIFFLPFLVVYFVRLNRRQMEMSQKAAEEDERYKKEMAKYGTHFGFTLIFMFCWNPPWCCSVLKVQLKVLF